MVLEERNREGDRQQQAQGGRGDEKHAARETGLGAGAAGAHGGAIGKQHVGEPVAEEDPLRHFARGAHLRLRGRRGRGLSARFEYTGGAGGGSVAGLLLRCGGGDGRGFVDDDGTHAGEVETTQQRADAQLAGPAEIDQKLHHGGTDLAELARKLVSGGQLGAIGFALQKLGAGVGERAEELLESAGQARGFFFRVNAFAAAGK